MYKRLAASDFNQFVSAQRAGALAASWVVVKLMSHFGVPIIIRRLLFRVPKRGP